MPGIEERYVIQEELKSVNEKLRYVEDQIERVQKEFVTVEESGMKVGFVNFWIKNEFSFVKFGFKAIFG